MPVVPEATPAQLDHPATQDAPETPVLPADPATQVNPLLLHAKPSNHHRANLALKDLPAHPVDLVNPETPVPTDNPDKAVETPLPDLQDQKDLPAHLVNPATLDSLATLVLPLNLKDPLLDPQDLPAMLALPDNPEDPDSPETMDNPAVPDPKDPLAHPVLPETPVKMDNLATPVNPEAKETRVSAPNTVPSTVVFSSKMEPDAKRLYQKLVRQIFELNLHLFDVFLCLSLFSTTFPVKNGVKKIIKNRLSMSFSVN